ncbi:MAG: MlaD family protein [Verrucomicrobiaceae bacterium]|nr:MlaD family protein [Verrucomicrobiaceae bacterium]
MQLRRNEILTGVLVLATVAALTIVLILLGAPGLFKPLVTYRIYMDNAAGIKLGAPVLLAGRKIGQVNQLFSPITAEEAAHALELSAALRGPVDPNTPPALRPRYEARIDVLVDKDAAVYKDARTRLITLGLLGETAIDIVQGTHPSGRAADGQSFAGERVPEFGETIAKMLDIIQPVATEATATLKELQTSANNLSKITDEQSQLNMALAQMRTFAENLTSMTATDSPLQLALKNVESISTKLNKISTDITSNNNIEVTLQNFRDSSEKLKSAMNELSPDLEATAENVKDLTDTVKRQPWRLVWPSTKKYPEEEQAGDRRDAITVRKSAKAQRPSAAASPSPRKRRDLIYTGE